MARTTDNSGAGSPPPEDGVVGYIEPSRSPGDGAIVPRVLDVGDRLACAADVRDGLKPVHDESCTRCSTRSATDRPYAKCAKSSAKSWVRITRTATQRSTTPWCEWCRTSRCATRSSAATETSEAPDPTRVPAMRYTECRLAPWRSNCSIRSTKRRSTSRRTTTTQLNSRRCCRRASRTSWSTAPRHRRGHGDEDPTPQLGRVIDATLHLLANPEATPMT